MKTQPSTCRVHLEPQSEGIYGVRFQLSNTTHQAIPLKTYQPFTQFQLRAETEGVMLPVDQPALDIPVQPVTLTVPANGTLPIATPIKLRIQSNPAPTQDGFVWTIARAPKSLCLTFSLDLPAPFDEPCRVEFD